LALILNIETATKNCSVTIAKNGDILGCKELNNGQYSHAEVLHPFIDELLSDLKIDTSEIDAIAVSKGPGSYTGLRIGVSAAKGLCFAKAEIIDQNSFSEYLKCHKVYFLGDGANKCKEIINHKNAIFIDNKYPSAIEMAVLSYQKYKKNDTEDVAYFEPFYLKDFVVIPEKKKKSIF